MNNLLLRGFAAVLIAGYGAGASAADMSVAAIRAQLTASGAGPARFAGHDFSRLDLSGLDFSGADLSRVDLSHARLNDARFVDANLSGADLDGTWLIGADFTRADLSHVHMFGPVVARGLKTTTAQSPVFAGADFSHARVIARLSNGRNVGAVFRQAELAADMGNQSMGLMRFEAEGAHLRGADFSGAALGHALFKFADLRNTDFRNADIRAAEFDGANLSGARFGGADARGASFAGARLTGARGIDRAQGMAIDDARTPP